MSKEEAEKFRQEGREEVLDYLVAREIVNYSSYDNEYFKYNWKSEILTVFPWRRNVDIIEEDSPEGEDDNES